MSGTSLSQNTPSYLTKATVHPGGYSGTSFSVVIPWVGILPVRGKNDIVVLTQDESDSTPAGLYVLVSAPLIPGAGTTFAWKLLMSFADICDYSNGATLDIYLNNVDSQTLTGSGLTLWRNGAKLGNLNLVNDPTSVWIAGQRVAGTGGVSTFAALTDSPLANSLLATLLGTKVSQFQLYDASANVPAISSGTLPSTGTNALVVSNAGVTTLSTPIDGISAVRYQDGLVLNASLGTWQRIPGPVDLPFVITSAITLSDVYDDCTLTFPTTQVVTVNTGLVADFGCTFIGPFTLSGTETAIQAGNYVVGGTYTIVSVGTTNFTLIGAASNTVGVVFTATGAGTGTGTANGIIDQRVQDGSVPVVSTLVRATSNTYVLKGSK